MPAHSPSLDDMLTPPEMAEWWKIGLDYLKRNSRGKNPRFIPFKPSNKVVRYHVRTQIVQQMERAGFKRETINASLAFKEDTAKNFKPQP